MVAGLYTTTIGLTVVFVTIVTPQFLSYHLPYDSNTIYSCVGYDFVHIMYANDFTLSCP